MSGHNEMRGRCGGKSAMRWMFQEGRSHRMLTSAGLARRGSRQGRGDALGWDGRGAGEGWAGARWQASAGAVAAKSGGAGGKLRFICSIPWL